MVETSQGKQPSDFSLWLRTGRLPSVGTSDDVQLKFNPWHDPADGQFTFVGTGHYHGVGGAKPARQAPGVKPRKRAMEPRPKAEASRAGQSPSGERPVGRVATGRKPIPTRRGGPLEPVTEFIGGVGEGLHDVVVGTAEAVSSALTTNPITTVRSAGRTVAGMIETAIAAEDTPARIQLSRGANAIANASPRDMGRAAGSLAGNAVLVAAPGAALGRVSRLRRFPGPAVPINYDPPQVGWVKENLGSDKPWVQYNNDATGARPGLAPTLMRTMPDGSKRPVKFDGMEREFPNDRKMKVVDSPKGRAQAVRQSEALTQNGLIGTWEVPNAKQQTKAREMLRKMNIGNIKVRIVEP